MNWILLKLSQKWQNYVKWRNITRAMCSPRPPSEGPSLKAACLLTELEIQLLLTGLWNNFSDDEISRKCQKNGFSGIFPTFSARNEFFPEIGLRHILGIAILHLCAKHQQNLMSQSREKLVTNGRTNGQRLIYRTSKVGPKKSVNRKDSAMKWTTTHTMVLDEIFCSLHQCSHSFFFSHRLIHRICPWKEVENHKIIFKMLKTLQSKQPDSSFRQANL